MTTTTSVPGGQAVGRGGRSQPRSLLALAAVGPLTCGACLGIGDGLVGALRGAVSLPLVIFGVAAITVPALYIGSAYLGQRASLKELSRAVVDGMTSIGLVTLGLSPGLLFMVSSATERWVAILLGHAVVMLAAFVGLRALYARFVAREPTGLNQLLFACWSLVALAFGFRFFNATVL